MKNFLVARIRFVVGIIIILVVGGAVWYIFSNRVPTLGSYTVSRGNIVASVNIPGTVSSSSSVDLSFQESGQIDSVYVKEGQSVTEGEALAKLDDSTEQAGLNQNKAMLAAAQANLASLEAGSTPEEISVAQSAVANAQKTLLDAIQNGYVQVQDGINNKIIPFFGTASTIQEPLILDNKYYNLLSPMTQVLSSWNSEINATTPGDPQTLAQDADNYLTTLISSVDSVSSDMNEQATQTVVPLSTVQSLLAQITSVRLTLTTSKTSIDSALSTLISAEGALTLAQAGPTTDKVAALQAQVEQAQAGIENAQLSIAHATITAPFSGTVRNVIAQTGMVVSPSVSVLSIINNQIMKIDAYAPETDVSNVQGGAAATVNLDSYGDNVNFSAKVTAVDTAETTMNGSPAYHITLYFTEPDSRILAGMTGNVTIATLEHDNVVEIPSRLVLDSGNNNFVLIENGAKNIKRQIILGLQGDDGMVEVVSGLNVGEKISDF